MERSRFPHVALSAVLCLLVGSGNADVRLHVAAFGMVAPPAASRSVRGSPSRVWQGRVQQQQQQLQLQRATVLKQYQQQSPSIHRRFDTSSSSLFAAPPELDVIALVAGQENYGLAIVCVGEALWSFLQAPSFDAAKVLIPAVVAALVLVLVSGPMITSLDASSVATGLWIATAVSVGLGLSYVARLLAPFSASPKEIAAVGLLVALAGFFSFAQNLVVDGFVAVPSLPAIAFPQLDLFSNSDNDLQLPSVAVETPISAGVELSLPESS